MITLQFQTIEFFEKENPGIEISLRKFSSLLQSSMPGEVFLCMYHGNAKNLCDCLSKEMSSSPPYSGSFVDHMVCNSSTEECMPSKCANCRNWFADVEKDDQLDELIKWSQWERETHGHSINTNKRGHKLPKR